MILDPRLALAGLFASLVYWAYVDTRSARLATGTRSAWPTELSILLLALSAAVLTGAAIATAPLVVAGAVIAVSVFAAVLVRPVIGAYALLGLTPLIVGIDRGRMLPLLRPNEALLILVAAALVTRHAWWWAAGKRYETVTSGRVLKAALAVVFTSTVVPILWLVARGLPLTLDDLTHAMTLAKYVVLFLVIRDVVRTTAQARTCVAISVTVGAMVGLIGALQSLGLFGVPQLLEAYYLPPFQGAEVLDAGRGSSTIANAIAVGDVLTFNLLLVLAFMLRGSISKRVAAVAIMVLLIGVVGSGQISAFLLLGVGFLALGFITRTTPFLVPRAALAAGAATIVLFPVIQRRIEGFGSGGEGGGFLPLSWEIRWSNLTEHFWPVLFSGWNWLLGVRPFPRLEAPEGIKDFIFIESGYTYLLWTGGIPLLAAFVWLMYEAIKATAAVARSRTDDISAIAAATYASFIAVAVLMLLDPHHIMRGAGDLLYPMLALSLTGSGIAHAASRRPSDEPSVDARRNLQTRIGATS